MILVCWPVILSSFISGIVHYILFNMRFEVKAIFLVVAMYLLFTSKNSCMQLLLITILNDLFWCGSIDSKNSPSVVFKIVGVTAIISLVIHFMWIWFTHKIIRVCITIWSIVPKIMGPHKKISCINFHVHQIRSHIWHGKPSTTSMGQLFLLLLFKKENLFRLQLIKVRENCGIAMFLTVVNKSCKCDLSQRGVPYMDAERLYLEIRCNMLCSVMCGYCCWICLISLSSHIF